MACKRSASVSIEVAVDRGAADAKGLGDGAHRVLPRRIHLPGHLEPVPTQHRRPTAAAATGPGGGQASSGAFADQVALELGQGGKDVEDELATGSGGVDRLLEAAEPDATAGQAGEGIDQVPQGAAKAIEFPDDQGVARAQLVQDLRR
jgi:hypothetical protein